MLDVKIIVSSLGRRGGGRGCQYELDQVAESSEMYMSRAT